MIGFELHKDAGLKLIQTNTLLYIFKCNYGDYIKMREMVENEEPEEWEESKITGNLIDDFYKIFDRKKSIVPSTERMGKSPTIIMNPKKMTEKDLLQAFLELCYWKNWQDEMSSDD